MATVTVTREPALADSARAYAIIVDGNVVGKVKNRQSFSCQVPPGSHTIMMKLDWCGSRTLNFTVGENETVCFRTVSGLRGLRIFLGFWYVLFDRSGYIVLERV